MRIDELSRELHAQAAEAMAGRTVAMADLRARRSRVRRRRAVAGGVLAVALVAVGSAAGGSWLRTAGDPGPPVHPGPAGGTSAPPSPDAADWRPVRCNRPALGGCALPATLRYDGQVYADHDGGRQPLFAANGVNRELGLFPVESDALLLVGATGAGPGSRLEVTVGAVTRRLPPGRLTAVPKPAGWQPEVVVRETGTPVQGEVLRIEGYVRDR